MGERPCEVIKKQDTIFVGLEDVVGYRGSHCLDGGGEKLLAALAAHEGFCDRMCKLGVRYSTSG